MNNKTPLYATLLTLSCLLTGQAAIAGEIQEKEENNPVLYAQNVLLGLGDTEIKGVLGAVNGAAFQDVDFYRIYGRAGQVINIDIDQGIGGQRDVDTLIAVFSDGPEYKLLRMNDNTDTVDSGSTDTMDSRIEEFVIPKTGNYYIGVSIYTTPFQDGAVTDGIFIPFLNNINGDYVAVVSSQAASSTVEHVSIDIKPGNDKPSPINPSAKGVIPVAILSNDTFDARKVDTSSLTFGHSGDESSLKSCQKSKRDVNRDGKDDLVCHFYNQKARFMMDDLEGVLKGKTLEGKDIEGKGYLKVVPRKKR